MRFSWGVTRFVVLVGPIVIKFARIRVLWVLRRLLVHLKTGQIQAKAAHQAKNPGLAMRNIFAGILANRFEHRMWRATKHEMFVPTICTLFWIVNIQWRGSAVSPTELESNNPFTHSLHGPMPEFLIDDITKPANYCWYEGRLRLCDYGYEGMLHLFPDAEVRRSNLAVGLQ